MYKWRLLRALIGKGTNLRVQAESVGFDKQLCSLLNKYEINTAWCPISLPQYGIIKPSLLVNPCQQECVA